MSKTTKPIRQEAIDMAADLKSKIEETRASLNNALIKGDRTDKLRSFLRDLEAEQQKLDDATASEQATKQAVQEAAQRAVKEAEHKRIVNAAQTLADARDNRLAVLATRYAIPARPTPGVRSSSHA
ncbi:hypothetical protein [Paraburkholderia haematera]|uniref:Uncharacterized protein n=1 Tax=Paraburkholderia haematera TaxID=2793077 RepID=A0ABM8QTD5_9BURK|nr:hypothetical protein [Paraburkholderia haematera]CAE6714320.1 hypothetical protein R69888_01299 [Paraburkholderia haematera]